MKQASPTLLPLLRTRTQGEMMAAIFLDPEREHTVTELAAIVGAHRVTALREVDRLQDSGLVATRRIGNTKVVRALTDNVVYRPLRDLLAVTFGPIGILRGRLSAVPGIERALIYGSWAARYHESPGAVPGDIDVLVIGAPDRDALDDAVEAAEQTLRREVNVRTVTPEDWAADHGPFKRTINQSPMVTLIDTDDQGEFRGP